MEEEWADGNESGAMERKLEDEEDLGYRNSTHRTICNSGSFDFTFIRPPRAQNGPLTLKTHRDRDLIGPVPATVQLEDNAFDYWSLYNRADKTDVRTCPARAVIESGTRIRKMERVRVCEGPA
ncbi:hypothetical protein EVAR_957_1 [Eumeta japonica]|uniref:Uncharacterized protein n=1 Tax=Eumeta variegata TaxID=151549 RepID=A0A4C1SGU5_EUMVA|nr:hypothetical protein EVAR_957_1 [Eumeta japonica]